MYEELVKRLRELPHLLFVQLHGHEDVVYKAADVIEELSEQSEKWEEVVMHVLMDRYDPEPPKEEEKQ